MTSPEEAAAREAQPDEILTGSKRPHSPSAPAEFIQPSDEEQALAAGGEASSSSATALPTQESKKQKHDSNKKKEKKPYGTYQGKKASRHEQPWGKRENAPAGGVKVDRLPKKKTAVMIGFCGTGYHGMQYQADASMGKTIESTLFEAFVKAGAVSSDNADDPHKVGLGRAARTDKGVHAAGNVVSLKMITAIPGIEDVVQHINTFLPEEIRVWGLVRSMNSFNARLMCDSRIYEYLLPSHVLLPPRPETPMAKMLKSQFPDALQNSFWTTVTPETSYQEVNIKRKAWRIDQPTLQAMRDAIKNFEGTHNFHNFTVGIDFNNRAAKRFMKSLEIRDPVVYGETEWISVKFHGQSFMLHQIRKMISLVILVARSGTPPSLIAEMFGPKRVNIPKAPALGLLLERPIFEGYNTKVAQENAKLNAGSDESARRDPIDFDLYNDTIEKFKEEKIYVALKKEEDETAVFSGWTESIDSLDGPQYDYLNSKGVIPQSAVKGEGSKKGEGGNGGFADGPKAEIDSDDDLDTNALKSGELEG